MLKPLFFGFSFLLIFQKQNKFLFAIFCQTLLKTNSCVEIFSFAIFSCKKIWQKQFFLFGRIFLFSFLISSIQEKHFCEQTPVLLVLSLCISLSSKKKTPPYFKNEFLSIFCVFLYSNIFHPFFVTFCFCSFRSHLIFSFPFVFDLSFSWLPVFLNTISPSCVSQNSSTYPFLNACVTSVCPFAHGFCSSVVSVFLFVFFLVSNTCVSLFLLSSLSKTSRKDELKELLQSKKNVFVYLPFCWAFFIFICLCIFCFFEFFSFYSHVFLNIFLFEFSFLNVFPLSLPFYVSLFLKTLFGLIILFLSFFSLLLHTLLAHKNVKWIFPKRLDRLRGRYQSQCASSGHGWHGDEAKRSKQTWQNVKAKQRWISN